jgi:aminopeptidase YwaD
MSDRNQLTGEVREVSDLYREVDRHVIGEIWTSDVAYQSLKHLCDDIGHRFGGSDSEHNGAEYLASKMREYGLQNVHLEEFPMYSWERGECFLAMTEPVERSFSAISMPYAGTAEIDGDLIDVGEGEAPDFERLGDAIRGKIVLTDAETNRPGQTKSHRTDKYRRAVEYGAIACIFINQNPGLLHITGALYARNPGGDTVEDHTAAIPGIGVSFEAGMTIRRLAERGNPKMTLRVRNSVYRSKSYNVVGDIPGNEKPDEIIVFGGHYDGHDIAPGATDDTAGTLTGLEAGRALAPFAGKFKRTIRIVCFGCEEIGLLGSWNHCDQYAKPDSNETLKFMVNLDGAGRGKGGLEQVIVTGDDNELINYFDALGDDLTYDFSVTSGLSAHSDHFPYFLAGYPSATLRSQDATAGMIGRGYGHTEADTVDKVTIRGLQMSAVLVARIAARLANDEEFPAKPRTQDEVRSMLESKKMDHFLEHHWGRANRVL